MLRLWFCWWSQNLGLVQGQSFYRNGSLHSLQDSRCPMEWRRFSGAGPVATSTNHSTRRHRGSLTGGNNMYENKKATWHTENGWIHKCFWCTYFWEVLYRFIKPILGNRYGPGVASCQQTSDIKLGVARSSCHRACGPSTPSNRKNWRLEKLEILVQDQLVLGCTAYCSTSHRRER